MVADELHHPAATSLGQASSPALEIPSADARHAQQVGRTRRRATGLGDTNTWAAYCGLDWYPWVSTSPSSATGAPTRTAAIRTRTASSPRPARRHLRARPSTRRRATSSRGIDYPPDCTTCKDGMVTRQAEQGERQGHRSDQDQDVLRRLHDEHDQPGRQRHVLWLRSAEHSVSTAPRPARAPSTETAAASRTRSRGSFNGSSYTNSQGPREPCSRTRPTPARSARRSRPRPARAFRLALVASSSVAARNFSAERSRGLQAEAPLGLSWLLRNEAADRDVPGRVHGALIVAGLRVGRDARARGGIAAPRAGMGMHMPFVLPRRRAPPPRPR